MEAEVQKMIDHTKERLIGFEEAARRLPPRPSGAPIHPKTVYLWATRGLNGVALESLMIGQRRVTSVEACQRFFEALTVAANNNELTSTGFKPSDSKTTEQLTKKGLI